MYRRSNTAKLSQYLQGLFHEGKHNIERMTERIKDSDYQQLHHFISVSPWAHTPVIAAVSRDISKLFENRSGSIGLILDESGHRKAGKKSVGVSRQYLGSIGKVDNGQVAVLAALTQKEDVAMVDTRLFLPEVWTEDKKRCDQAGIPTDYQAFKTKPMLGLEMIKSMEGNVKYDWIGGDCLYGNSTTLRKELHNLGKLFVMDVGEDTFVYLKDPQPYIPPSKSGRGRKKSSYVSDEQPIAVKKLLEQKQWKTYTIRQGTKGPMVREVVVIPVYVWGTKSVNTPDSESLNLIISRNKDGSEIKYSLSNNKKSHRLSDSELLYRQMQRYWVERGIQDCKDSLGMTDYQVRGWKAWHHHMTLTIMALQLMVEQKVIHKHDIPLLSCPDIKFFLALTLPNKANKPDKVWALIQKRHLQRQNDLNRYK